MSTEIVLHRSQQGPVAYVRLSRPGVRNAFNAEMIAQLTRTFTETCFG